VRQDVLVTWNGDDVKRRAASLIGKSTWTVGMAVMSDAKLLCPVDYGYLAASIMVASKEKTTELDAVTAKPGKFTKRETKAFSHSSVLLAPPTFRKIKQPGAMEANSQVFVGTAVEYGPYIEFGTIRSDAQPFLRPALDMARGKVPQIVQVGAKLEFAGYLK
jgi:HK97 gp10 family phage protein